MSAGTQPVPMPWTPAPPQLVMAYSVCKGITRMAAKNFYYGLKLLPEPKRSAMFALYAYMRLIDDIADDDDGQSVEQRVHALDEWRAQMLLSTLATALLFGSFAGLGSAACRWFFRLAGHAGAAFLRMHGARECRRGENC